MTTTETVQRVRIYMGEHDRWEGQPLYLAVLERLRREGASGASALRGLAGFGASRGIGATKLASPADRPPVVIEWVDRADRITHTLPLLDDLLAAALVTIEAVQIYRAALRAAGRFGGDRTVGAIAQPAPPAIGPGATLGDALELLLADGYTMLPVVDPQRKLLGILSEQEIARRGGLRLPLRILRLLDEPARRALLEPVAARPAGQILNSELRSIYASMAIPQALATMIEWNYEQVPVVQRDGTLAGLLSYDDILAASIGRAGEQLADGPDGAPATPVRLVMQTSVPQLAAAQSEAQALELLLASPGRYLVVVDAGGRVRGCISDVSAVQGLEGAERAVLLAALQGAGPSAAGALPGAERGLERVMEREIITLAPATSVIDATRRLMELRVERAPVVDDEGRLLGMLTRGALVRALVQESE